MALALTMVGAAGAQEIKGSVLEPSPANLARTWDGANVVLPAALAGGALWQGRLRDMPAAAGRSPDAMAGRSPDATVVRSPDATVVRSPVVVVMHGSSGVAGFIKDYQVWLAVVLGLPSVAPDSMAIPDRLTYTSPVGKDVYERVHDLRLAELRHALAQVATLPWADPERVGIVGTSEGAVPVARLPEAGPAARIVYSWSCETNYFVEEPRTAIPRETPVLSVIASRDPYFSPDNPWNTAYAVKGHCAEALKTHAGAAVLLLASDKHTVMNTPEARDAARAFLARTLKP
ncbi:hypothetical protein TSO221_01140 [Azospirillum sp. TSO22-1]|nr:hypothetical protein TSO221_01140 [Azospirillum sp. TSO22-1]